MQHKKRIIASVLWIVVGLTLLICDFLGLVDTFWSGMGAALLAVGIFQLVKHIRYFKNEEYREKVDISEKDERLKFISDRAHAWTSYIYVIAAAVATIAFKAAGYDEFSLFASISLCFVIVVYAVAYLVLSRKY